MKKNNKYRHQIRRKKTRAERKAKMEEKLNSSNKSNVETATNYKMVDGSPYYQLMENMGSILENWKKGIFPLDDVYPTDPRSDDFMFPLFLKRGETETHLLTIGCSDMVETAFPWMLKRFGYQKWFNLPSLEAERLLVEHLAFIPTNGTRISKHIWDKDAYTYLLCENGDIVPEIKSMPKAQKDIGMIDCSRNYLSFEEQKKLLADVSEALLEKGIDVVYFLGISKELQEYYFNNPILDENGQERQVILCVRIFLKTKGIEIGLMGTSKEKMKSSFLETQKYLKEHNGKFPEVKENPFFEI